MAPTWQPTYSGAGGSNGDETLRVGTVRPTMATNPLLTKAELGKVKKSTFAKPDPQHTFGYTLPPDPEGAREVTLLWKEHKPTPAKDTRSDGRPELDFKSMNVLATSSGITTAKGLPEFRQTHAVQVKKHTVSTKSPALPSDRNAKHTYGMSSAHRNAETVRQCGPEEPAMKMLVQGAYQEEWVRQNMDKGGATGAAGSSGSSVYIPPVPTRAALGHAIGAQKYLAPHHTGEEWKMSKFKTVGSKVTAYMGPKSQRQQGQEYEGEGAAEYVEEQQ